MSPKNPVQEPQELQNLPRNYQQNAPENRGPDPLNYRRFLFNGNQPIFRCQLSGRVFFVSSFAQVASLPDAADALMLGVLMPPPEFLMASVCADLSEHLCHGPKQNAFGEMVPDYIEIFWEFANPFFDVEKDVWDSWI